MTESVIDFLKGLDTTWVPEDSDEFVEILQDAGEIVWMGDLEQSRWYINQDVVYKVKDKFIKFYRIITTGDYDGDLEYDIVHAHFVKREEDTDTHYYYA